MLCSGRAAGDNATNEPYCPPVCCNGERMGASRMGVGTLVVSKFGRVMGYHDGLGLMGSVIGG